MMVMCASSPVVELTIWWGVPTLYIQLGEEVMHSNSICKNLGTE